MIVHEGRSDPQAWRFLFPIHFEFIFDLCNKVVAS